MKRKKVRFIIEGEIDPETQELFIPNLEEHEIKEILFYKFPKEKLKPIEIWKNKK